MSQHLPFFQRVIRNLLKDVKNWNQRLDALAQEIPASNKDSLYCIEQQKFHDFKQELSEYQLQLAVIEEEIASVLGHLKNGEDVTPGLSKYLESNHCSELRDTLVPLNDQYEKEFTKIEIFLSVDYRAKFKFPLQQWNVPFLTEAEFNLKKSPGINACKITLTAPPDHTFEALQNALIRVYQEKDTIVEYLDLSECNLKDTHLKLIAYGISKAAGYEKFPIFSCTVLILSGNDITKEGVSVLLRELVKIKKSSNECKIKQIVLSKNKIDFDERFFKNTVQKECIDADLDNLDLTLNFIPKGFMFQKGINQPDRRIYFDKSQMLTELSANGKNPEDRIEIKKHIYYKFNQLKAPRSLHPFSSVESVIAGLEGKRENLCLHQGFVGLFANKNTSIFNEHAYLVLEGISKFGQRYIIRADLCVSPQNQIDIIITQCSPQEFLNFTKNGETAFSKTARITRNEIKAILKSICESRDKKEFINYSINPNINYTTNTHSCLTWAADKIKPVVNFDITSFVPGGNFKKSGKKCPIL